MWELLISPIDPTRAHEVSAAVSWHGRVMVFGWAVLAPLAVMIARFFKILPGQDWPRVLDTKLWWRSHWIGQSLVFLLTLGALVLVLPSRPTEMGLHGWLGYLVVATLMLQVGLGLFRGSKGGPAEGAGQSSLRGHHYDMTPWRRLFEAIHKALGYGLLALGAITILLGLWKANAPVWMWLLLGLWWPMLVAAFIFMQGRGMAVDTYQAIWGADSVHPGNRLPHPGWGVRRFNEETRGETHVRSD